MYLEESGGEGDEESGGGPEEGAESDDVSAVVADGEVSCDRVAERLDHGPEQRERAEGGGVGVESLAHLLVDSRKQRLVRFLHDRRHVHQHQRHRLSLHDLLLTPTNY